MSAEPTQTDRDPSLKRIAAWLSTAKDLTRGNTSHKETEFGSCECPLCEMLLSLVTSDVLKMRELAKKEAWAECASRGCMWCRTQLSKADE